MTQIAPHITAWFHTRLPIEQSASPNTCDAYATALRLFLIFTAATADKEPVDLCFEDLDAAAVLAFLQHLRVERKNTPRTSNARLAAIKSFMRFMQYRHPAGLDQVRQVLAVPAQRVDVQHVQHLDRRETQALVNAPDPTHRSGIRDRALLLMAVTAGLRVSELIGLQLDKVGFREGYVDIAVMGKGRRERALTLWREVADAVRAWLAVRGQATTPELFVNAHGRALTRSGVEYILGKHVRTAAESCPSLAKKKVSPHVLRHTCAMNTLRATRDVRKVALWLGHASVQTTEIYLRADPTEKLEMLEAMVPPSLRKGHFTPPDRLLALLRPS